jgi:fermentation-respiration switch protein FrsA (DUF1100 family)
MRRRVSSVFAMVTCLCASPPVLPNLGPGSSSSSQQDRGACGRRPVQLGPGFLAPTVSDVPTLIVSGERDPVTPPSGGEKALRHIRRGIHVVIPDGAHSDTGMKGLDCEDEMALRLIETGSTERFDSSCVTRIERPAFALRLGDPEVTVAAADLDRLAGIYREGISGYEARVEVVGGKRLRARFSDGGTLLLVPISPTRFRTVYDRLTVVFRLEEGRAAGLSLERYGQPLGGEMTRVP